MLERVGYLKASCIFLALLSTWNIQCDGVVARKFEKCSTRDGRQGVCVVKRYCREASTNPNALVNCGNEDETFCCPVPSPRSAVFYPPTQVQVTPKTKTTTTATTTTERPFRYPTREDEVRREQHPRQSNRDKKIHYAEDDEREYVRNPERPYPPPRSHGSDSREREESREYDRRYGNEGRTGPRQRPSSRGDDQGPIRPPSEYGGEYDQPRRSTPAHEVTRFPGNYETSRPRPTVPACGVKPYDLFIAGGEESLEHEWPWMTAIFRRHQGSKPSTFTCGGSLINTRYVLSAAHCFVHNYVLLPASSFFVRLGSHYLLSGEDYTVATIVVHQNHSSADFFNDIALLRLASEVFITDKIAPVCLPSGSMLHEPFVGRKATVAGWGDTSFRVDGPRILQHVTVPVVSNDECAGAYSRVKGAAFLARGSAHVICAGLEEGGKDACLGDSGGPLMVKEKDDDRWIIIGIVSLGYKCAQPGFPGVYTRVTHYLSWIYAHMRD